MAEYQQRFKILQDVDDDRGEGRFLLKACWLVILALRLRVVQAFTRPHFSQATPTLNLANMPSLYSQNQ